VKKNIFYAQSGGVTAVINASACGVIETARKHRNKLGKVYAGRNGILGALTEDMIDTSAESAKTIAALRHTPGGAFGSARYKLKGLEQNRAEYERLIEVFKAHDIGYFFYNGGGDSMDTAYKVSQLGKVAGWPLTFVCTAIWFCGLSGCSSSSCFAKDVSTPTLRTRCVLPFTGSTISRPSTPSSKSASATR
jgi:6-phosphofructokinase 1